MVSDTIHVYIKVRWFTEKKNLKKLKRKYIKEKSHKCAQFYNILIVTTNIDKYM